MKTSYVREQGVPVWRDKSDIPSNPPESGIEHILKDTDKIAGGISLVSEAVTDSDVILEVELPRFRDRWDADDTFFVVIVRCPDIGVRQAKSIPGESSAVHDQMKAGATREAFTEVGVK